MIEQALLDYACHSRVATSVLDGGGLALVTAGRRNFWGRCNRNQGHKSLYMTEHPLRGIEAPGVRDGNLSAPCTGLDSGGLALVRSEPGHFTGVTNPPEFPCGVVGAAMDFPHTLKLCPSSIRRG